MKAPRNTRPGAVTLPVTLDIRNAQEFKDALVDALGHDPVLRLNGAETRQLTTPGVQILLAASRSAAAQAGRLVLTNPSPAVKDAFAELGLEQKLNEWTAVNG